MDLPDENRPSLLRRLAAVLYDGMLLIALWMGAGAAWIALHGGNAAAPGDAFFRLYLLGVSFMFFVGFWVWGGRTLGLQAWRMRLIDANGQKVGLVGASNRFFAALLSWLPAGAGFLWALFDRQGLTWHDRLSRTYLYLDPKRP
ncbi:RDD family protein [Spiribacter sp. 218]|uniref:RDD family protein n=1 Tax=Spiribacter pallidus TaxID=1987936 RepID=UPI00349F23B1